MSPWQVLWVALRALLRNKLRASLTTLGVVIGVGAVIAMTSIGEGAKARVAETFEAMGSNMLILRPGARQAGGARGGAGSEQTLTWQDLDAIRSQVDAIAAAAAVLPMSAQLQADGQNWATSVQGTSPEFFTIRNWEAAAGELLQPSDVETGAKVVLLGQTVADNLFGPGADPLDQIVRIQNVPFRVSGVLARKGPSSWGSDNDDVVFVPQSTFRAKLQGGLANLIPGSIYLSAVDQERTKVAQEQIEQLLRRRHRLRVGTPDDFTVRNLSDMANAQQEGAETMTMLLAGIALVSLLVGGIGIMNIMLVSVTERTREIGLRMALGARPIDILAQFLAEALVLSIVGGGLGIASGLGVATWLVQKFDWPMLVRVDVIWQAVAISCSVGVVFGLWPAWKASRFDPISALRFE